jgi:hypothetical protein
VALLRQVLARYASISARVPQTRGHDDAPPNTPGSPCPPTSRARHPRRFCPRSEQGPPYCTFSTSCSQGARRDTCSCGEVVHADRRRATTCSRFLFLVNASLLARLIRYPAAPGRYKNRVQHVTALARVSSNNSGMWRKAPVAQSCSRQTTARDNLFSPGSEGAVRDARRTTGRKSTVRAATEHVHHAGARSRNTPAQRSCTKALHRCAHGSACAEGRREWRIGEGRGDTGRTYILRRREVYSVRSRPQSWKAPASAQGHARAPAA